jgi:hypothetical protein
VKRDDRFQSLDIPPTTSQIFFALEHPASASGLLAPPHVHCARFLGITCSFEFQVKHRPALIKSNTHSALGSASPITNLASRRSHRMSSTTVSATTVHRRFVDHVLPRACSDHSTAWHASDGMTPSLRAQNPKHLFEDADLKSKASVLIKGALHSLIGIKRRILGIRTLTAAPSPSLIEIAPAVWNFRYLNVSYATSLFIFHC